MYDFLQSLKVAIRGLLIHKGRAFLTSLGITIGIASVVMVVSIGSGAQSLITNQVTSLGSNLISVLPGGRFEDGPPVAMMGITVTTLKLEDADAINDPVNVPNVVAACAYVKGAATVTFGSEALDSFANGVSYTYTDVENAIISDGRFFTEQEQDSFGKVVVLGATVASDLFNGVDPIGQTIKVNREPFTVIGVLDARGAVAFQDRDNQVFIPVSVAQKIIFGLDYINLMRVKVDSSENIDRAKADIEATIRVLHDIRDPKDDDFMVESIANLVGMLMTITGVLKFFLAAIAAISLVIGGVGIMNIMLVSVTERTREIGLRKALGAKKGRILEQFLFEAIVVTLIGGTAGIAIGVLISGLVALVVQSMGYDWDLVISWSAVFIAFSVSCAVGMVFGYYPAKKAANLNPIEALRHE
jgi:putative ABC transport system permease protein